MKSVFDIEGMTCSACQSRIEREVNKLDKVSSCSVNLVSNKMQVIYDDSLKASEIEQAVENIGYKAFLVTKDSVNLPKKEAKQKEYKLAKLISSLALLSILMYVSMGHMINLPMPPFLEGSENTATIAFLEFILTLPILYLNKHYFFRGFLSLFKLSPNMDSLIAIGSAASVIYSVIITFLICINQQNGDMHTLHMLKESLYYESGATILTFVSLGKYLESISKSKSSDAIKSLSKLCPKTCTIIKDGNSFIVNTDSLKKDDVIVLKAGLNAPCDGIVLDGEGSVNEAMITGESMPVDKNKGSKIISGTTLLDGFITYKVTKDVKESTLSSIIELVENSSNSKPKIAKLADRISFIFVPIIISLAIITFITWLIIGLIQGTNIALPNAINFAISVLVISCPCALGLATPMAVIVTNGRAAKSHILIKKAEVIESLSKCDVICLDKTGTITEGMPSVSYLTYNQDHSLKSVLQLALSCCKTSTHPVSKAIVNYITENHNDIDSLKSTNIKNLSGLGIKADVKNCTYFCGNARLMNEQNIDISSLQSIIDSVQEKGNSILILAKNNEVLALFGVSDKIKDTSVKAIESFNALHIKTVMITGDSKKTADFVASKVHVAEVLAEVMPEDKDKKIELLQQKYNSVAMIGDGINDAPALSRANTGIAIGNGTDVAIDSADIILMQNSLLDAYKALRICRLGYRNMKQNLFWACFYNSVAIPLAAGCLSAVGITLNPMIASAAMCLSSISVILNALRIYLFNINDNIDTKIDNKQNDFTIEKFHYIINESKTAYIKGENKMAKTIEIKGMTCNHCVKSVTKALEKIDGISNVKVFLDDKNATCDCLESVSDDKIKEAIEAEDFEVVKIS